MKYIKHIILTAMAVVVMTGAWAQTEIDPDPYTPTQQTDGSWMFTMPAANKLLEVEYESRLDSVRTTWEVYINGASTAVHPTPYSPNDPMGYVIIPAGADVKITPTTADATKVKDLEMFQMLPRRINLDTVQHHLVAQNGDTLTGTLAANVKISIANGATVTLNNVTINGTNNQNYNWAGITCEGNVTIVLSGTNTVKGFNASYPGIFVPQTQTLTINGTGSLTASSNGYSAGIGGGSGVACGNIEIQGGTITATGGERGAGIGGAYNASWGNITISGGTVNATGGEHAAGIGGGRRFTANVSSGNILISGGTVTAKGGEDAAGIGGGRGNNPTYKSSCGTITITSGVTSVTATKGGTNATNSIGAGRYGTCGTVTIGGEQGAITASPYTYPAP